MTLNLGGRLQPEELSKLQGIMECLHWRRMSVHGEIDLAQFSIDIGDAQPIRQPPCIFTLTITH